MIGIGTTLNQRFLLKEELGRGGMGAVFSATDEVLQRNVAIKLLKEQSGEEVGQRLRLEARIAARLLHDNVVRIYDFGEAEGTWYLVMEEVVGSSYVKRWRALTPVERLRILAQVADALDYAHHQGVIHRDIKPGNVLLTDTNVPKLSDFGLSLLVEQGDQAGSIRGTPHYMSPEQARGKKLDFRTDLYSLGVMLYESVAGTVPFTGTAMVVIGMHASKQPDSPRSRNPQISESLENLILSLLAKQPEARPVSGAAVAQSLREEIERISTQVPAEIPHGVVEAQADTVPSGPDLVELAKLEREDRPVTPASAEPSVRRTQAPDQARPLPPPMNAIDLVVSPLVRKMLRTVLSEPVILSADERYLMGHYLAYLLIGSWRGGLLLRRPADRRNADRARYLLAVTYSLASGPTESAIQEAATLLDQKIEVRPALSPVIVAKYLSWRETPQRRRLFRQTRKALQEASKYARKHMTDAKGQLNPGLVPQTLDDLRKIAPPRNVVDDVLVERWNRLVEAWRDDPDFRTAALRYASRTAYHDPASQALWPEVVYPFIELARWQRRHRSRVETLWDGLVGRLFHLGDAGPTLDRLLTRAVPSQVVARIDDSVDLLAKNPPLDDDEDDGPVPVPVDEMDRLTGSLPASALSMEDLDQDHDGKEQGLITLVNPDPVRFLQGELHQLWKEAVNTLASQTRPEAQRPTKGQAPKHAPLGPYRLVVIPSIRGRAAGQVAIQGMSNKQIELTTPTFRTTGSAHKPILAVWIYQDNSLVISHLDFNGTERFVLWNARLAQQLKLADPADLHRELENLGMEPPERVEDALSRRFRPRNTV